MNGRLVLDEITFNVFSLTNVKLKILKRVPELSSRKFLGGSTDAAGPLTRTHGSKLTDAEVRTSQIPSRNASSMCPAMTKVNLQKGENVFLADAPVRGSDPLPLQESDRHRKTRHKVM